MLNQLIVDARVSYPPEFKTTSAGDEYAVLTVAHNKKRKDGSWDSMYIKVTAYKYAAKACAELQKGDRVLVTGPIMTKKWLDSHGKDRFSLDMTATDVLPLRAKAEATVFDSVADVLKIPTFDGSGDNVEVPF